MTSDHSRPPRLALFAEMLFTGIVVFAASVPLVTAAPAIAAGVAHLRRHLYGHPESIKLVLADVRGATSRLWGVSLAALALGIVLVFNVRLAQAGVLVGEDLVIMVSALVAAAAVVVLIRTATAWSTDEGRARPGTSALDLVRRGARDAADDVSGSLWLVAAVAACAVFVWMLPPLICVVGGLVCFAAVGVDHRLRAELTPRLQDPTA